MGFFKRVTRGIGRGVRRGARGVAKGVKSVARSPVGKGLALAGASALLPGLGTSLVGGALIKGAVNTGTKLLSSPSLPKIKLPPRAGGLPDFKIPKLVTDVAKNLPQTTGNDKLDKAFRLAKDLLTPPGGGNSGGSGSGSSGHLRDPHAGSGRDNDSSDSILAKIFRFIKKLIQFN